MQKDVLAELAGYRPQVQAVPELTDLAQLCGYEVHVFRSPDLAPNGLAAIVWSFRSHDQKLRTAIVLDTALDAARQRGIVMSEAGEIAKGRGLRFDLVPAG